MENKEYIGRRGRFAKNPMVLADTFVYVKNISDVEKGDYFITDIVRDVHSGLSICLTVRSKSDTHIITEGGYGAIYFDLCLTPFSKDEFIPLQ